MRRGDLRGRLRADGKGQTATRVGDKSVMASVRHPDFKLTTIVKADGSWFIYAEAPGRERRLMAEGVGCPQFALGGMV